MGINTGTNYNKRIERFAEKLHIWYLEATKKLDPESYNEDAQKKYSELSEEQKEIDRYIARKIEEYGYENGILLI